MPTNFLLKWEETKANRVVKKEKVFANEKEMNKFRKQVMQRKGFFKLVTVKGNAKGR